MKNGIVALALAGLAPWANATCCGDFVSNMTFNAGVSELKARLGELSSNIVQAINALGNTVNATSNDIATKIAESGDMMAKENTKTQMLANRLQQEERYHVMAPCGVTSGRMSGAMGARAATNSTQFGRGSAGGGRNTATAMEPVLKAAEGQRPPLPPEITETIAAKAACQVFAGGATGEPERARLCRYSGGGQASSGFPDADIRAETLFDGPQGGANYTKSRLSIHPTINGNEKLALDALVRNLTTPTELRGLTQREAMTEDGRRYMALKDTYMARMSLAEKPMRDLAGRRLEDSTTIPILNQIKSDPIYASWFNSNVTNYSRGVSADELMDIEVERRYGNRDWSLSILSGSPEAAAREGVLMQALTQKLMWRMVRAQDMTNVLLGQIVAADVRKELQPDLRAAHAKAVQ